MPPPKKKQQQQQQQQQYMQDLSLTYINIPLQILTNV